MNESILSNGRSVRDAERDSGGGIGRELAALTLALFAIYSIVCLILGHGGERYIGQAGVAIAQSLQFLFGIISAFAVPAFLLLLSIQIFIGQRLDITPRRLIGVGFLIPAVSGLLALPYADEEIYREVAFRQAGAMGVFLAEWDGLGLAARCGLVGASMILGSMALLGLLLITGMSLSSLALWIVNPFQRRIQFAGEPLDDPEFAPAPSTLKAPPDEGAGRKEARGAISRWFGGRERPLAEPHPEESDEVPMLSGYDEDVLAAAQALENAKIDEEYERALREEEEAVERMLENGPPAANEEDEDEDHSPIADPELDEEIRKEEEIVFSNGSNPVEQAVTRNPRNADLFDSEQRSSNEDQERDEDEDLVGLGGKLAEMFPSRWDQDEEGEVIRKDPSRPAEKSYDEIQDSAEERMLRRCGAETGEDDPLFDESLETRPRGVDAAIADSQISAMERDLEIARRNKRLSGYRLPEIELLDTPPVVDNQMSKEELRDMSATLEKTFADFNISAKVVEVTQGPVVTRFELKPAPGVKVSKIVSLEHDIAMAMKAVSVRIVAPIPGKAAVGIELPNKNRQGVYFRELVSCSEFWDHPSPLAISLGKTIEGKPYFADLKKMPHLLIAGATGAGKSVCLNTIICSLLFRQRPDRLRVIMVDPKRVEMSIYQDIPHLISPVVCEPKRAASALSWAVEQMEERYKKLVEVNVRNIDGYNDLALSEEKPARLRGKTIELMPHMVIIVDELADLMVVAKNEVEESIQRLAQMARAVGIHLILATQRPSVNVITGIIKANFPTRIAFQVSQKVDSRTILDSNGAENLLGRGDMLFAPAGAGKPIRLQGAFLSDAEVERISEHTREEMPPMYEVEEFEPQLSEKEQKELAKLMGNPQSMDDLDAQQSFSRGTNQTMGKVSAGMFVPHDGGSAQAGDDEIDEALVRAAARVVLEGRKGSTSMVQRRLKVGFARAGRLMDMLEEMGIVGPYKGSKPRDVLVDPELALDQLDALEEQIQRTGSSQKAANQLDGIVD